MILDAWGWCTGTTQRDGMGTEEGGGRRVHQGLILLINPLTGSAFLLAWVRPP